MDDEDHLPSAGESNSGIEPSRNFRTRRSSSSLISSTTSSQNSIALVPLPFSIQTPSGGNNRSPGMSRQPYPNQRFLNDEDEHQPSSSTSSAFPTPRSTRSSSPLGSPDSTYWGPSSLTNSYHHHSRHRGSIAPNTSSSPLVQDSCGVSSSTMDDIPPSPFSPNEDSNNSHNHSSSVQIRLRRAILSPSPVPQTVSLPIMAPVSNVTLQNGNGSQPIEAPCGSFSNNYNTTALSHVRNKIKKASSFERFSAQAQANSNNASSNNQTQRNLSQANENIPNSQSNSISGTSVIQGSSRSNSSGTWDYNATTNNGAPLPRSNFISSLPNTSIALPSGTKPYHIKKLAVRLANVLEAEAAAALAANENTPRNANSNTAMAQVADGTGRLLLGMSNTPEPLNSSSSSAEPLMRKQLSQSPLNLTENSTNPMGNGFNSSVSTEQGGLPSTSRLPVISTKPFSNKKIPLTPKQKLLFRMQSGEIAIPMSTTPPPAKPLETDVAIAVQSPIPQEPLVPQNQHLEQHNQHPHQLLLLDSLHNQQQLQQLLLQESIPPGSNPILVETSNERYASILNNYEAFIRTASTDEFGDVIPRDDMSSDPANTQILYDSSETYNYYYGGMLSDEIFTNGSGGSAVPSSSRLMHSSKLVNAGVDDVGSQFQIPGTHGGQHVEYALGLPESHTRDRGDDENEIELVNNESEMHMSQQQMLDPEELSLTASNVGKSQLAEISTLRNLLLEPVSRTAQHEESWIQFPADYQNRINIGNLRLPPGTISAGGGFSSGSNPGLTGGMLMTTSNGNSWNGEWSSSRAWQGQGQQHDGGEQDEVMDMSVMEVDKSHLPSHTIGKGGLRHNQSHLIMASGSMLGQNVGTGMTMDDVDLDSERDMATSLPLLTTIDLQQTFVNHGALVKNQIMTDPSALLMNSQSHHHRDIILQYDEEPVNLMAAVNLDQSLVHHHSGAPTSSGNMSVSHNHGSPEIGEDMENTDYGDVCVGSNIIFTTTSTTSTTVETAGSFEPSPPHLNQQDSPNEIVVGALDDKRIILVKKKVEKDKIDGLGKLGMERKANFIPDKPVQPKSFASLPSILSLTRMSGNGWGVLTSRSKKLPANIKFGPVDGPLRRATQVDLDNHDTVYPVFVMVDNMGTLYQLDRTDDDLCNWMKFVRRARSGQEQNVLISEEDGLLYFTTCREIPPKTELQVGYGLEYAQKYKLPYFEVIGFPKVENHPSKNSRKGGKKGKRKSVEQADKYSCFECDANLNSIGELNHHLDTVHKELDNFQRPKKKAIQNFYLAQNNENSNVKESKVESTNTIKRRDRKKQMERRRKELEEIPIVESSSPDLEFIKTEEVRIVNVRQSEHKPQGSFSHEQEASSSNISSGTPKIKCSLCYKAFATRHRLQRHMVVHSEDHLKPLKCNACGKRFVTNSALAGHAKSHEDGKYFECPFCPFTTQQVLHLKEHVQSHRNEETGAFNCPHCSKGFPTHTLIRKHIRAFHGPRLFSCEDCSMKFPTPDKLKLHELRHSSFRAYLCAECGRQFKRKDKLTDHARKAHGKLKSHQPLPITRILPAEPSIPILQAKVKMIPKKVLPRLTEIQLSSFTFRCQQCMIGFRRRGMLVNHLAKRHPEINPDQVPELSLPITRTAKNFYCPHCERIYKSSSKRKSHILKNHPGKSIPPQVRGKDLKAILEEGVGSTTIDFSLNEFEGSKMEQLKSTVDKEIRKEAVVGEIMGTPQRCQWCRRQYATRAKLLQHQRKFHIELMPPEIQIPRPQKNNVKQTIEQQQVETSESPRQPLSNDSLGLEVAPEPCSSQIIQTEKEQTIQSQTGQENMYGYLITTTTSGHDLETLLQPEFVMNLLSQQNQINSPSSISTTASSGPRTIICIQPSMLSTTSHQMSTNPTNHLISSATGINISGTQILTKTD